MPSLASLILCPSFSKAFLISWRIPASSSATTIFKTDPRLPLILGNTLRVSKCFQVINGLVSAYISAQLEDQKRSISTGRAVPSHYPLMTHLPQADNGSIPDLKTAFLLHVIEISLFNICLMVYGDEWTAVQAE